MKAVLSNRVYLEVTPEYGEHIKKLLTYKIPSYHDPDKPILIRNFGVIRQNLMTLPIGRTDLIPEGYEIVDKRVLVPDEFPEFNGHLRDSQQAIYDVLEDNAIINAKPSWGKTFAGLAIAGKLEQKTLVVVHTVPLRNQWAKEVRKVYGMDAGIIGSGRFNLASPIVIGNVQSLYNCVDRIQRSFGTIILDEMHHVSSPTFSKVIDRCYARYKIGLSGTLDRKDGKHVVFNDYFGYNVFKPPAENFMQPEVDVINSGLRIPEIPGACWADRVTAVMDSYEYRNLVHALADQYKGHKILVVSDRVQFLKEMAATRPQAVCIVGGTPQENEEREEKLARIATDKDEVWGTLSIFKEGISQNELSLVILGTPINNDPMLEQVIGRVQRILPGKLTPRVVDIRFSGYTGEKQFQARLGFYMRMGYKINYL